MFLLDRRMKERPVFNDGSADGRSDAIAVEVRLAGCGFNGIAGVERGVLHKDVGVAVEDVCPGAGDHIDRAA